MKWEEMSNEEWIAAVKEEAKKRGLYLPSPYPMDKRMAASLSSHLKRVGKAHHASKVEAVESLLLSGKAPDEVVSITGASRAAVARVAAALRMLGELAPTKLGRTPLKYDPSLLPLVVSALKSGKSVEDVSETCRIGFAVVSNLKGMLIRRKIIKATEVGGAKRSREYVKNAA